MRRKAAIVPFTAGRRRPSHLAACIVITTLATQALLAAWAFGGAVQQFSTSYAGLNGGSCSASTSIIGVEPVGPGPYPLFIWTAGTNEPYDDATAQAFLTQMANRGFIAASMNYPHNLDLGCNDLTGKYRCMFGTGTTLTGTAVLCARPEAGCGQGIVVTGISQGAQISTLAKNGDSRIVAAYGLGDGDTLTAGISIDMTQCMDPVTRALPAAGLVAINGESDAYFGGNPSTPDGVRRELQSITSMDCGPLAWQCSRADESGWYEVQDFETQSGKAIHVYLSDANYKPPYTFTWSMIPNLDLLASRITGIVPAGYLQFKYWIFSQLSNGGSAAISVSRSGGHRGTAAVNFAATGGSAVPGVDYSLTPGTLNWADGDFADKNFSVTLFNASGPGINKTVWLSLSGANGAAMGAPQSVTLTIVNVNNSPTPTATVTPTVTGTVTPGAGTPTVTPIMTAGTATPIQAPAGAGGILAYPNPWRADRDSARPMAFSAVPDGSTLKIYNVSGELIASRKTENGQATWEINGGGKPAAAGIYLYFIVTPEGQKIKGKAAVIR